MSKTTRATRVLSKLGVSFSVIRYDYNTGTECVGLQAAQALGEGPRRVLQTLMAEVDGRPVCVIIPPNRKMSMRKLTAAFGGKSASMSRPADAERLMGYRVGGIGPLVGASRFRPRSMGLGAQRKTQARSRRLD